MRRIIENTNQPFFGQGGKGYLPDELSPLSQKWKQQYRQNFDVSIKVNTWINQNKMTSNNFDNNVSSVIFDNTGKFSGVWAILPDSGLSLAQLFPRYEISYISLSHIEI